MKQPPSLATLLALAALGLFGCGCGDLDDETAIDTVATPPVSTATIGESVEIDSLSTWANGPGDVTVEVFTDDDGIVELLSDPVTHTEVAGEALDEHVVRCAKEGYALVGINAEFAGGGPLESKSDSVFVKCVEPVPDNIGDFAYSISTVGATFLANYIDMVAFGAGTLELDADSATRFADAEQNPCGPTEARISVCGDDPLPAGEVVVVVTDVAEPIPHIDEGHSLTYAVVFDSDADPTNNWQFQPPFDWDQYQGADRWYEAKWDFVGRTWTLTVTQVANNQTTSVVRSAARAVISDNSVAWFIPRRELSGAAPTYRTTTFGHDGSFSPEDSGGDVSGVDPTVPLTPLVP